MRGFWGGVGFQLLSELVAYIHVISSGACEAGLGGACMCAGWSFKELAFTWAFWEIAFLEFPAFHSEPTTVAGGPAFDRAVTIPFMPHGLTRRRGLR